MATYDNKIWLLKNIRDAFIATDDTGLCEIVMAGEDFSKIFQNKALEDRKRLKEGKYNQINVNREGMGDISEDDDDREIVTQYDPYPDMEDSEDDDPMCGSYIRDDFGGHRQRSNTAQRLDKKEQALKKAAKIKVIKWENPAPLTSEQIADIFAKVEVEKVEKQKSLLAEQLENCPDLPHRQYLEYAKFDGTAQLGLPTKLFKIFMTILPEKHPSYPLVVCVIANAKIKDLIGFTCYKYSIEHPEVTLGSVQNYGLCIAEEDGEVDIGFPCLDANEPCSKFGFTCLGLVDLHNKNVLAHGPIHSIPDDGTLYKGLDIFPKASDSGHSHHTQSRLNTGDSTTSETVKSAIKAVSNEKRAGESDLDKLHSHMTEPPQYKMYRVNLLRKVRTNIPVQLVISIDKIEVEPLIPHKHAFWSKSKYFLHSIDSIAWCQILEAKATKTTFRVVYSPIHNTNYHDHNNSGVSYIHSSTTYKYHDFECEHDTAKEIVDKINIILDRRNSPCRRDYKIAKEKKLQTRRSFHTKHIS
ncbi:stress-activated map kinase-interacting protein 1 isoform X1 [Achroia grisella]|uniref:stress-activated map kinase-interacting protein 1 isoform X1 n=1 Tax=Achroia grisella TaxID=688607 RepID=UPI0027D245AF|nr:stress-activated map kinase-interacting protein 1 isoform X1 [Achroia grisella]